MTLSEFIDANRGELDAIIRRELDRPNFDLDDDAREDWINNDPGLYEWATSEGCFDEEESEEEGEDWSPTHDNATHTRPVERWRIRRTTGGGA